MERPVQGWQHRTLRIVVAVEWVALSLGIFVSLAAYGVGAAPLIASATGGAWVLVSTGMPRSETPRAFVVEILALVGVTATTTALTLTGASGSPFLLLAATPAIHVTVLGPARTGLATGILTGLLILVVSFAQDLPVTESLGPAALVPVMVLIVAQIRRILVELDRRAFDLEGMTGVQRVRIAQLEETHQLLQRLSQGVSDGDFNLPRVGRAALEALQARYPDMYGRISFYTDGEPVILATIGDPHEDLPSTLVSLEAGRNSVGELRIHTPLPLPEVDVLQEALRPATLALANARLLQAVAGKAIAEERLRLARDLHDEVGPSLASLGLSLDVAMGEASGQAALVGHLGQLRDVVGRLVEEIRHTVADLREPAVASLARRLDEVRGDLPTEPSILVDLDERRPPRPTLSPQIHAIVCEALRNAVRHSGATKVEVRGWLDYDKGRVVVEDDGDGFDPESLPPGHFGILGMRERAELSGIRLELDQTERGTRVVVNWGAT